LTEFELLTELGLFTELKSEAEFVSHPDSCSTTHWPSHENFVPKLCHEPRSRSFPMVRDDDDVGASELRRRRVKTWEVQGGPKKVSHYQMIENRIKSYQIMW